MKKIKDKILNYIEASYDVQLPDPLKRLVSKRINTAIIVFAICIISSVLTKQAAFLTGWLIAVYLIYAAVELRCQYAKGSIRSCVGRCIAIKTMKNSSKIVLEDNDGESHIFIVNGKNTFFENVTYVVYTAFSNEKICIAYQEL